jgi:hypothetical protein
VLIVEGDAATGKTTLFQELVGGFTGGAPCAYVDLEAVEAALGEVDAPQILAALAFQLARRTDVYGPVRFDRLATGLLAMRLDLSGDSHEVARRKVTAMLRDRRDLAGVRRILDGVAEDALAVLPGWLPTPVNTVSSVLSYATDKLATGARTRDRLLGAAQAWYAHQDRGLAFDAVDELVELNPTAASHLPGAGGALAGELLCGAFLADLREHFTGRKAQRWLLHGLILLDNVDSPPARAFVRLLARVQEGPRALGVPRWDPVAIVASSRGALFAGLTRVERATVREVQHADDVLQAVGDPPAPVAWLRRSLPNLTAAEVRDLVEAAKPRRCPGAEPPKAEHPRPGRPDGDPLWLRATVLHQIAGGHPGGTRMLLTTLADDDHRRTEPEKLLRAKRIVPPRPESISLEDALRIRLLVGVPDDALSTVETCAMARNRAEAQHVLGWMHGRGRFDARGLPRGLWDATGQVSTTLLRLLLLRRLAWRPAQHRYGWAAVCRQLHERCTGDPAAELHYLLAGGRVEEVTGRLSQLAGSTPVPAWLTLLDEVVRAPRNPVDAPLDPGGVGGEPQLPFVRDLVAELWTVTDPVCGTDRGSAHWHIASAYRSLAQYTDDSSDELLERIFHHEELARRWTGAAWPVHQTVEYR